MSTRPDNLLALAGALRETWSPKVVGRVNDHCVKVARLHGDLAWHQHDAQDELFLVLQGHLRIEYHDHSVELGPGDFHVVPMGTMHNPVCDQECLVALIEPVTTRHTGHLQIDRTRSLDDQLA